MNKKVVSQEFKIRSSKVKHFENGQNNQQPITKISSKDDIVTLVKESSEKVNNNKHISSLKTKNLKINDKKPIKNLIIHEPTTTSNCQIMVKANNNEFTKIRQSVDSTDLLLADSKTAITSTGNVNTHRELLNAKEKWKEVTRLMRKNLRTSTKLVKYEDTFDKDDENMSSVDGRRSTLHGIDGLLSHRRFTRESVAEDFMKTERQLNNKNSYIRSAIPCLSVWCAIICFVLNILVPGSGTALSGLLAIFFGKPRIESKTSDQYSTTVLVNMVVGVCQLCTTVLMLVGWFWSVGWGVYMMTIACMFFI